MDEFELKVPRIVKDWAAAIFGIAVGVVATVFAAYSLLQVLDFNSRAITTEATVLDVQNRTRYYKMVHKGHTKCPLMQFRDTQGNLQQARCPIPGRKYKSITQGETFTIAYLPEDPAHIRLDNNSNIYGCLFLLLAGTTATIMAGLRIRTLLRKKAPATPL